MGNGPLPTYPKGTSTEVSQGVCFPRYDVIKSPGCFVLAKVFKDGHVAPRWKAWNIPRVKLITNHDLTQHNPENPGDYKHSAVFASYTRIISLYGAIRFTLSGYSRSVEFSIKDSICKKMSSNCSGDGLASQHVCDRIPTEQRPLPAIVEGPILPPVVRCRQESSFLCEIPQPIGRWTVGHSQVAHCQRPPWLSTTGLVKDENWCGSIA